MTPEPEIVDAALRKIEADSRHPTRILAAKAVAEFRGREQQPMTKINQHDNRGGRRLDVDACIQCSQPNHAPIHGPSRRLVRIPWLARLCWWR